MSILGLEQPFHRPGVPRTPYGIPVVQRELELVSDFVFRISSFANSVQTGVLDARKTRGSLIIRD
jgi:hypothetical protein